MPTYDEAMRRLVLVFLVGCGDPTSAPDAMVDGKPAGSFYTRIGEACDASESPFCEAGAGRCFHNTCRAQCSQTNFPRCTDGFVEHHEVDPDTMADACTCLPQ